MGLRKLSAASRTSTESAIRSTPRPIHRAAAAGSEAKIPVAVPTALATARDAVDTRPDARVIELSRHATGRREIEGPDEHPVQLLERGDLLDLLDGAGLLDHDHGRPTGVLGAQEACLAP